MCETLQRARRASSSSRFASSLAAVGDDDDDDDESGGRIVAASIGVRIVSRSTIVKKIINHYDRPSPYLLTAANHYESSPGSRGFGRKLSTCADDAKKCRELDELKMKVASGMSNYETIVTRTRTRALIIYRLNMRDVLVLLPKCCRSARRSSTRNHRNTRHTTKNIHVHAKRSLSPRWRTQILIIIAAAVGAARCERCLSARKGSLPLLPNL